MNNITDKSLLEELFDRNFLINGICDDELDSLYEPMNELIFLRRAYDCSCFNDKRKDDDYHQIKTDEPLSHRDIIQELLIRGLTSECDHNIYVGLVYNNDAGVYDIILDS